MAENLKAVFDEMKRRYKPGAVDKATSFYFSLGDEAGQKWTMTLTPKECKVVEGKIENADCVLKTSAELFVKMMTGKFRPGVGDFLSGKVKSNDPEMLKLLESAFGPAKG